MIEFDSLTAAAQQACHDLGLVWKQTTADGRFHRLEVESKPHSDGGTIKLFPDGEGGIVCNWITGEKQCFWYRSDSGLSPEGLAALKNRQQQEIEKAAQEQVKRRKQAARKAAWVMESDNACPVSEHGYLTSKQVTTTDTMRMISNEALVKLLGYAPQAKGGPLQGDILMLPVWDHEGISSIQMIDAAGRKSLLAGGQLGGKYWATERLPDNLPSDGLLMIGEGAATVLSAVEAAPGSIGVAAFGCGNLRPVALSLRKRYPSAKLVILSDLGNGERDAEEAAKAAGGILAVPVISGEGTDFNDLHQSAGLEEVARQLAAATVPEKVAQKGELVSVCTDKVAHPAPTPLPDTRPPVKALDELLIPGPLRGWLLDIAERMQIPPDFSTAAAIVALGSIIGRGCGMHPKQHDDWLVVPNLWGAVIGRPSMMKTPAMAEAFKPIDRLEIGAREEYQSSTTGYAFDQFIREEAEKGLKDAIKKALRTGDHATVDRLKDQYRNDQHSSMSEPARRRFFTSDATPEKICHLLNENPRGMLLKRDELIGWLSNLDRDGRENARSMFLEGWNGTGRYSYDTIKDGTIDVEALCLSVFGAITPGRLEDYIYQANKGGAGDDGLMQRFQLAVWPDSPTDWKMVDRWPDTNEKNRAYEIYQRLSGVIPGAEQSDNADIPALRFAPDAQGIFNEWLSELENRLRKNDELTPALESHLAKYRSLMPSLALIYHLVDVADGTEKTGPVSERATAMSVGMCEYLESHAQRIYSGAGSPDMEAAREIIKHILRGAVKDGSRPKDIYRNHWTRLTTPGEVEAGLDVLAMYDWLTMIDRYTGGRPTKIIKLNPSIKF